MSNNRRLARAGGARARRQQMRGVGSESDQERHRTRTQLASLKVSPKKERGQNFLVNPHVLNEIAAFGAPQPDEHVLEIGPGLGALTKYLADRQRLTLVEIEPAFAARLRDEFPQAVVIESDFRRVDLNAVGSDLAVFGNIPYVYSTDILFCLIEHRASVTRAVLLLQREFAERVAAAPGGRAYGVLSVMAQLFCDMRLGPIFEGTEFFPPAAVQSRVLELRFLKEPRVPCDHQWLRRVVEASFLKRRKMIHNSLKAAGFQSQRVESALANLGIDPARRAETLSLEEFASLARELRAL